MECKLLKKLRKRFRILLVNGIWEIYDYKKKTFKRYKRTDIAILNMCGEFMSITQLFGSRYSKKVYLRDWDVDN